MARFSDEAVRLALCGPRTMQRYAFPGNDTIKVGIRLLTDAEMDGCRLRAGEIVKRKGSHLYLGEVCLDGEYHNRLLQREIVAASFFDADAKEQTYFFADADEVASLDNHTIRACWNLYELHAKKMDPYAHCSVEEAEALSEQLGKSESAVVEILNSLDTDSLQSFALTTALQWMELKASLQHK